MVPGEESWIPRTNRGDLLGRVAVAGVGGIGGHAESARPALCDPALIPSGDLGDVIVLNPGQMPDQPRNRVGLGLRTEGQGICIQASHRLVDQFPDPVEGVGEDLS